MRREPPSVRSASWAILIDVGTGYLVPASVGLSMPPSANCSPIHTNNSKRLFLKSGARRPASYVRDNLGGLASNKPRWRNKMHRLTFGKVRLGAGLPYEGFRCSCRDSFVHTLRSFMWFLHNLIQTFVDIVYRTQYEMYAVARVWKKTIFLVAILQRKQYHRRT